MNFVQEKSEKLAAEYRQEGALTKATRKHAGIDREKKGARSVFTAAAECCSIFVLGSSLPVLNQHLPPYKHPA